MSTAVAEDPRELIAEAEALAWEAERRGMSPPDFGGWQDRARPEFDWSSSHFRLIFERLDRMTAGEIQRLMLQVSIRHGKTETVKGYICYRLEKDPTTRVVFATHSERQALKISRQIRRLIGTRGVEISRDRDAAGEWETVDGGGLMAVGAGTGLASVNADLIVIDDPIGSRKDAESQAHRDRVWDWITTDVLARSEPHTSAIFSMPRWHVDDPAGRLQERQPGNWDIIDLPGVAVEDDMLGRVPGEILWASWRPQSWVDQKRVELGPYGFESAVQCRPTVREGGQFERSWFPVDDEIPRGSRLWLVRHWDLAATEDGGAYTCGALIALRFTDGLCWICDVVRGQWGSGDRDRIIVETAHEDAQRFGPKSETGGRRPNKLAVLYHIEQEPGSGGKDQVQAIKRKLKGFRVESEPASGDKFTRADPLAGAAANGDVHLIRGHWNEAFLSEMENAGPGAAYLDQMDSTSAAFNRAMDEWDRRKRFSADGTATGHFEDDRLTRVPAWRVS